MEARDLTPESINFEATQRVTPSQLPPGSLPAGGHLTGSSFTVGLTVFMAALGYFIDVFDLSIFGVVRLQSLQELEGLSTLGGLGVASSSNHKEAVGSAAAALSMDQGVSLINIQMFGMLVGSLFWGVLGDLKGRTPILLGAPLVYAAANLGNGWIDHLWQYQILRFIAGFGLAGELGASITLIAEIMTPQKRGYGTTLVATMGILGGLTATLAGGALHWRQTYILGGVMGLALVLLRLGLLPWTVRGHAFPRSLRTRNLFVFWRIIATPGVATRFAACIFLGVPIWYVLGVVTPFSPELAKSIGIRENVTAGVAIFNCSIGVALGDLASGLLSQWFRSRKKVIFCFLGLMLGGFALIASRTLMTAQDFYLVCLMLGFGAGYWAILVTIAAEQFGSNVRTTVATTVPNFVRASVIPMSLLTTQAVGLWGVMPSMMTMAGLALVLAGGALWGLRETYGVDLNFLEP